MRRSASCVSLKLQSIQISRDGTDRHQALPDLDVVAGIDVAAGHDAVDVAGDVAVAQVQLRLFQVARGLQQLASACLMAGALGMICA